MKNKIAKLLIAVFVISCTAFASTFANSIDSTITPILGTASVLNADGSNYFEISKAIRAEIDKLTEEIKTLNEYNASVNQKYKALSEEKGTSNKNLTENIKKIKELRSSISRNENKKEKVITEDSSIKTFVQNKEYGKAIEKLNLILAAKREQLAAVKERTAIWQQIDALLN